MPLNAPLPLPPPHTAIRLPCAAALNCEAEWTPWTECTRSCAAPEADGGQGIQLRAVVVTQEPGVGGAGCPLTQSRHCNPALCPAAAAPLLPLLSAGGGNGTAGGNGSGGGVEASSSANGSGTPNASAAVAPPPTPPPTPAVVRPAITLLGSDLLVLEASFSGPNSTYADAGASCSDSYDGDISHAVELVLPTGQTLPDPRLPRVYELVYTCVNSLGNAAPAATRTVWVRDTACPRCVLRPGPSVVEASFAYVDPGVDCTDSLDGPLAPRDVWVFNSVNVSAPGTYVVLYRARDSSGNWNDGRAAWQRRRAEEGLPAPDPAGAGAGAGTGIAEGEEGGQEGAHSEGEAEGEAVMTPSQVAEADGLSTVAVADDDAAYVLGGAELAVAGNWTGVHGCAGGRSYVRTITVVDSRRPVIRLDYAGQ